jgi:hypothetical protein
MVLLFFLNYSSTLDSIQLCNDVIIAVVEQANKVKSYEEVSSCHKRKFG